MERLRSLLLDTSAIAIKSKLLAMLEELGEVR
jgi:hypothetical protein